MRGFFSSPKGSKEQDMIDSSMPEAMATQIVRIFGIIGLT
jgi:outer membrane lipopolysaccharide assembly protein LptE/RlpB